MATFFDNLDMGGCMLLEHSILLFIVLALHLSLALEHHEQLINKPASNRLGW